MPTYVRNLKWQWRSCHLPYLKWPWCQPLPQCNFPKCNFTIARANCSKIDPRYRKEPENQNTMKCGRCCTAETQDWQFIPRSNVWCKGWKSMLVTLDPWLMVKARVLGRSSSDHEACWGGVGYVTWIWQKKKTKINNTQ